MLIYIGKGEYLAGIPARDLTEEEVKAFGGKAKLLATGLYKEPDHPKAADHPKKEK